MLTTDAILLNDWHAVAKVEDLPPFSMLATHLLGEDLVLWRGENQVMAWQDWCPHRGARLSMGKIDQNRLICPYHGLAYNLEGKCVEIPAHPELKPSASACIQTYSTQEKYGLIWVRISSDLHRDSSGIAPFFEWEDDHYRKFLCGPYPYESSGFRAIENFLDVSHFPFIHEGMLGDRYHTSVADYQVKIEPAGGIYLENVQVWQPDPDGTGTGGLVTYHYRVWRPLSTSFVKETIGNHRLAIYFTVVPVAEEKCLGWMWIAMNYGYEIPEAELKAFQDSVVRQDIPIVESQRPKRLPLNLPSEFHLPCDRASIEYRKWLKKLGIIFGVIH
jgi:phenylpropionate dioxygenase-like ring-hydroxylating dioxygenase large terminal subunit